MIGQLFQDTQVSFPTEVWVRDVQHAFHSTRYSEIYRLKSNACSAAL